MASFYRVAVPKARAQLGTAESSSILVDHIDSWIPGSREADLGSQV